MKRISIVLLFFLSLASHAQESFIAFKVGVGTYIMKNQKQFQVSYKGKIGLPLQTVDEFPPYLTFGGTFGFKTSSKSITGIAYDYYSTGGRLHYKDYSGELQMDQLLNTSAIGLFYQVKINQTDTWPLYFRVQGSIAFSQLTILQDITVWGNSDQEEYIFKSQSFMVQPGLVLHKSFNRLLVQAGAGVELGAHGALYLKEDKKVKLYNSSGKEMKAQWDGFRGFISVGILLDPK